MPPIDKRARRRVDIGADGWARQSVSGPLLWQPLESKGAVRVASFNVQWMDNLFEHTKPGQLPRFRTCNEARGIQVGEWKGPSCACHLCVELAVVGCGALVLASCVLSSGNGVCRTRTFSVVVLPPSFWA